MNLPVELWLLIFRQLHPRHMWILRCVSREWQEVLSSESIVKSVLQRYMPDDERDWRDKVTIFKNHMLKRPASQYTVKVGMQRIEDVKLLGDRVVCSNMPGEVVVLQFDLESHAEKSVDFNLLPNLYEYGVSDEIIAVKADDIVFKGQHNGVVSCPKHFSRLAVHKRWIAVACGKENIQKVWIYNVLTKEEKNVDVKIRIKNNHSLQFIYDGGLAFAYSDKGLHVVDYDGEWRRRQYEGEDIRRIYDFRRIPDGYSMRIGTIAKSRPTETIVLGETVESLGLYVWNDQDCVKNIQRTTRMKEEGLRMRVHDINDRWLVHVVQRHDGDWLLVLDFLNK